jgi:hypothetical protein
MRESEGFFLVGRERMTSSTAGRKKKHNTPRHVRATFQKILIVIERAGNSMVRTKP